MAAFGLPLLAANLRLPAVVLEILFGIAVGPAFGLIHGSEFVDLMAELGLFLLMFLAGFEVDFGQIEKQGRARIFLAFFMFVLTVMIAHWFTTRLGHPAFMTIVLATTSVGLVIPSLRSMRVIGTKFGQYVLIAALLADFLTLLLVALFALYQQHGLSLELLKIPALFFAIALVLRALRLAVWWYPERFRRLFAGDDPEEMGMRATLALMLAFVGMSMALDIEPILGAFLAGTVFAVVFRNRGLLEQQLSGFSYGFLIPIFFINVGLRFELDVLFDVDILLRAVILLGAAYVVKIVPSFVFLFRGLTIREVLSAGVLLSARLSLIIAVATVGVELGFLDSQDRAIAIVLAAATSTLSPSVFRLIVPRPRQPAEVVAA